MKIPGDVRGRRPGAALASLVLCAAGAAQAADFAERLKSPNQIAASGPVPGDVGLYEEEFTCQQAIPTPGYFSSLNAAEIADAQRSGIFPCATFTGSHDGPNQVFAWRGADDYPGIAYINNRYPGELYIVGGEVPNTDDPLMAGPYIAKADATTGKEIWRTYLDNRNVSDRFIGNTNFNILENGKIVQSWSDQIVLIDADTGRVVRHIALPTGGVPVSSVNYKHVTVAPDGTLILKNQTRPIGCDIPGTMGIIKCASEGMKMPPSHLTAVDPDTLEVLDDIDLPGPAASPHIVDLLDDKIAIYVPFDGSLRRYFWDSEAKKLSADESWVVSPLQEGQTVLTAASVVGDWISVQLNGLFTNKAASSVAVVDKHDASKLNVIFPFGKELNAGEFSFAPPKGTADAENSMIYSADMGMKKVAGIKLDQATGTLEVAFVVDDITSTFQPLIGPADKRVLLLTNAKLASESQSIQEAVFTLNRYTEQLTWRDAATGKLLAESDFFEPLTINSLTTPEFGGRVYFPTAVGKGFYVLQPMPVAATEQAQSSN